jgi:SAM-dependent methyltransferase
MREPDPALLREVERYYTGRLQEHGATARGVDWNSEESQRLRFKQLARLWEHDREGDDLSVIDFGCGYGALLEYLHDHGGTFEYHGFDISEAMIREANARRLGGRAWFTSNLSDLTRADYVVASGVFNVKLKADAEVWDEYMTRTIETMATLAIRGFAFNALTSYSDPEKRREDLYYADPLRWFDHCKRKHSRFVTLLHDYPLYEFTILVRN